MIIDFYECNKENLETVYEEYVKKVVENKGHIICTNVLCVVKYTKPKTYADEVIETDFKIITTPLYITWCDGQNYTHKTPFVSFCTKNVDIRNVIKFAKMEDIVWE